MKRRCSSCLMAIYIALLSPLIVECMTIVPKSTNEENIAKRDRIVELGHNNRNHDVSPDDISSSILPSSLSSSSSSASPQQRALIETLTSENTSSSSSSSKHSLHHTKISTTYDGTIPSSSLEVTIQNDRPDDDFVILSGLGLNIKIVKEVEDVLAGAGMVGGGGGSRALLHQEEEEELNTPEVANSNDHRQQQQQQKNNKKSSDANRNLQKDTPCRIRIYTKAYEPPMGSTSLSDYTPALDAHVMCKMGGEEGELTLLGSDYFIQNYRLNYAQKVEPEDGHHTGDQIVPKEEEGVVVLPTAEPELDTPEGTARKNRERRKLFTKMNGNDVEIVTPRDSRTLQDDIPEEEEEEDPTSGILDANVTEGGGGTPIGDHYITSHGLSDHDKTYPLLIPPNGHLSLYIQVLPVEDTEEGISFSLLSADASNPDSETASTATQTKYKSDTSLNIYTGTSMISDAVNVDSIISVISSTIYNGDMYYDRIAPDEMSLMEYYDELEYSLLPGNLIPGSSGNPVPGCHENFNTGWKDTVGSYGMMFDVQSAIHPNDVGDTDDLVDKFQNIEIYGMELYIRNLVSSQFDVYVRKNMEGDNAPGTQYEEQLYTSYQAKGQTKIGTNWEVIASGVVEGQGPGAASPVPSEAWLKSIVLRPGETIGFYVTVKYAPDLRYRNTTLKEGDVYASNGVLNVGVGRSWGEWPLREDGTDVFFEPREFSGGFLYHVQEGLCDSDKPSAAPTWPFGSPSPSVSSEPTAMLTHTYQNKAKEDGLCPEEGALETTYEDGTGSYGTLFDVLAKTDVTVTGIDLNIDWNTGTSVHALVLARQGSWFGHQNNAESWPYTLVDTTLYRPEGFHNRSVDGSYIPIDTKRGSAIIPRSAFTPLGMAIGETWSFYVCIDAPDLRYTLGSSIGKTFASNNELRIMEGAGAADYPPFGGDHPEAGGTEYTFYAPRIFNGNLRYDYVDDCPSEPPSSLYYTPVPTPTPVLTTEVTYTFYVEHSSDMLNGEITYDMSIGIRNLLDKFMGDKKEFKDELLYSHKMFDKLYVQNVIARLVSPYEIGYDCIPTPPQSCTPISVDVTATHLNSVTSEDIKFAFLRHTDALPNLIEVDGYTIQYVGDRAVETNSEITLSGVPDREMGDTEQEFFEKVAREFLTNQVVDDSENDSLEILSVTINGQEITTETAVTTNTLDSVESSTATPEVRNGGPQRRLETAANNIQVSVKGKYRPPPELDFGELVEDSINRDRELLKKELNKPPPEMLVNGDEEDLSDKISSYFANTEVVGAREIKENKAPPVPIEEDNSMKDMLNYIAMGIGGCIAVLSIAFFLRPHRRQAMFSSGEDNRAHRRTQQVDVEDQGQGLLKRGWGRRSSQATDYSDSYYDDDKAKFNPRGSANSSDAKFNPHDSANSFNMRGSHNSGGSGGSGGGYPQQNFNPRGSANSGGSERSGGYPPQNFPPQQGVNPQSSINSGRQPVTGGVRQPSMTRGPPPPGGQRGGQLSQSYVAGGTRMQPNAMQMSMPPVHHQGTM